MAWFGGKNTWGNFPDLAGAVNKLQESVKNIEKNFDTALGYEERSESSKEGNLLKFFFLNGFLISLSYVNFMIEVDAKSIN